SRAVLRTALQQLDAVSPRVLAEEPRRIGKILVPRNLDAGAGKALGKPFELSSRHPKCGMRLARGRELRVDADVELLVAERAPHAASLAQRVNLSFPRGPNRHGAARL